MCEAGRDVSGKKLILRVVCVAWCTDSHAGVGLPSFRCCEAKETCVASG